MKRLLEFPLEGGGTILVEVDESDAAGRVGQVSRGGDAVAKASETFEAALGKVTTTASHIMQTLRSLSQEAEEVSVEFGLKFNTEANVIIASTSMESSYKITLKWTREQSRTHPLLDDDTPF